MPSLPFLSESTLTDKILRKQFHSRTKYLNAILFQTIYFKRFSGVLKNKLYDTSYVQPRNVGKKLDIFRDNHDCDGQPSLGCWWHYECVQNCKGVSWQNKKTSLEIIDESFYGLLLDKRRVHAINEDVGIKLRSFLPQRRKVRRTTAWRGACGECVGVWSLFWPKAELQCKVRCPYNCNGISEGKQQYFLYVTKILKWYDIIYSKIQYCWNEIIQRDNLSLWINIIIYVETCSPFLFLKH